MLLPIEQLPPSSGPLPPLYKLVEQFPSTIEALVQAQIPLTPVLSLASSVAEKPLFSRFRTDAYELTVSTEFISEKSILQTEIKLNPSAGADAELFVPAVDREFALKEPIGAGAILDFVKRVQSRRHERVLLTGGTFTGRIQVNREKASLFVVDYPITVRNGRES